MLGIVLGPFVVVGHRQALSRGVVPIMVILVLDVGSKPEILGDSQLYRCQCVLFHSLN